MTDLISSQPIRFRVPALRRPALPSFAIGRRLAACGIAISRAFAMAYTEPFNPQAEPARDDDGRDPRW